MDSRPGREPDVLCFATQGAGSADERRILRLLAPLQPRLLRVERARRRALPATLLRGVAQQRPDVVLMEGTGVAGGMAVMAARVAHGVPFIVSSGDAVAPFLRAFHPRSAPVAGLYERALCQLCAGFVGWSPYLVGRAMTLGAARAITAAHFSRQRPSAGARAAVRRRLGIPPDAVVFGIVGSILIDPRQGYSYGVELVRALRRTDRSDLRVLVVGDGDGLQALAQLAGPELGRRVLLPGACPPDEIADYLAAMDVGSLPQSTDLVGSLRFTTKLPEYVAAGVPVVAGQTPVAYDLDSGWFWRLPGDAPWETTYLDALARLMQTVTREEIRAKAACVPADPEIFDVDLQARRVCAFVREVVARSSR